MRTILCADDFALSPGVSNGIIELIYQSRLSATSALVTTEDWPRSARALAAVRDRTAVGLHLNFTSGPPLGPMPGLAPLGHLPNIGMLMAQAFAGRLNSEELAEEIDRQFERFTACFGHDPDFVDGHEHVHILPGIRQGLLRKIETAFERDRILVRDPSDNVARIIKRNVSIGKAITVRALAAGFRRAAARAGALTNESFAGFTSFADRRGFSEFDRFLLFPRARHLVMCHPGLPDQQGPPGLHMARRFEEFTYLFRRPGLPDSLWHPCRSATEKASSIFSIVVQ